MGAAVFQHVITATGINRPMKNVRHADRFLLQGAGVTAKSALCVRKKGVGMSFPGKLQLLQRLKHKMKLRFNGYAWNNYYSSSASR